MLTSENAPLFVQLAPSDLAVFAGTLRGYSFAFLRCFRYSISRFNAAVTNWPVLSPDSFNSSKALTTSWGIRAAIVCDFALTAFVAMLTYSISDVQQYGRKKISVQHLTCLTPCFRLVLNTNDIVIVCKNKARQCANTNRASDQHVNRTNAMAKPKCNQTRPKNRVFLFLAVSRADMQDKPHREQITAHSEREARSMLAGRFILCFAGRLPVQEAHHV